MSTPFFPLRYATGTIHMLILTLIYTYTYTYVHMYIYVYMHIITYNSAYVYLISFEKILGIPLLESLIRALSEPYQHDRALSA